MFMPELSDAQYLALGRFTYQFGNLERWVNWGIIEAEDISDPSKHNKLPAVPFEQRLNRFELALCRCEKKGLIHLGKDFTPDFDFDQARDLGTRRNSLFHGEPLTLMLKRAAREDGTIEFDVAHVNFDTVHAREITLDIPTLEQMTKDATLFAERLLYIVGNVAAAKQARGRAPLRIGFMPLG
jgi:hypothetical protein